MVTLHISFRRNENSQPETISSEYPNINITPVLFSPGHEVELSSEAPFIAQKIWDDIDCYVQEHVLASSVTCVIEFPNGRRILLPTDIINAKHDTSALNS